MDLERLRAAAKVGCGFFDNMLLMHWHVKIFIQASFSVVDRIEVMFYLAV